MLRLSRAQLGPSLCRSAGVHAVAVDREILLPAQHGEGGAGDVRSSESRLIKLLRLRSVLNEPAYDPQRYGPWRPHPGTTVAMPRRDPSAIAMPRYPVQAGGG